ncbi:MAG: protein tyrosine phosphatase family protein [Gomphosphaeria aponina SAG 52.96 = DSM 107014]|uniref:Protein tyrosine phosphatase family protein n=1 Tax=Gomphosphaeria aponina SAG 52.96 = DSM 107014 TaxID=1521640 RepID=A0A941GLJ8_9CHRO|nr:protein tyrosine phosphatase family protein [Gomphosphaeria aponina SAG 52.96 = DSM 107014]
MADIKKINEQLSIAPQLTPAEIDQLPELGFKSVLNLRSPAENGFLTEEAQQIEALGIAYTLTPVTLPSLNEALITQVVKQIDNLPKPALIHCGSALRAGYMVILYQATKEGMTLDAAKQWSNELGFDMMRNPQLNQHFEDYINKIIWRK